MISKIIIFLHVNGTLRHVSDVGRWITKYDGCKDEIVAWVVAIMDWSLVIASWVCCNRSIVATALDPEVPRSGSRGCQHSMRLNRLPRAYPSLHPFGVVHWVPLLSNIKTTTGCESNNCNFQLSLQRITNNSTIFKESWAMHPAWPMPHGPCTVSNKMWGYII